MSVECREDIFGARVCPYRSGVVCRPLSHDVLNLVLWPDRLPMAPARSVLLIATYWEPSVSPSSTKLAPYRISGIAHFRYCSDKLLLAATERFGPIPDLVFLVYADAQTIRCAIFEVVRHRELTLCALAGFRFRDRIAAVT
jgi:hypothetical protein